MLLTPPVALPPAIVRPMQVAQASAMRVVPSPRGSVQIPIRLNDLERGLSATHLAICANLSTSHKGTNLTDGQGGPQKAKTAIRNANVCVASVEDAVRNGTITDAPAMALALRNDAFTSAQGEDKIALTLDDIASLIAWAPPATFKLDYNPSLSPAPVSTPFTSLELGAATIVDGRQALSTMTTARSIPIDPSTAYVMTAADVVVHPARYAEPGKSLAELVPKARLRHSASDDKKLATLCMTNNGSLTLQDCQEVAARNTAQMIVNGQSGGYDRRIYTRGYSDKRITKLSVLPAFEQTPVELLDAACSRETTTLADACFYLAMDYEENGNGLTINSYKALSVLQKGCNSKSEISCQDHDRLMQRIESANKLIESDRRGLSEFYPVCNNNGPAVKYHCDEYKRILVEVERYYSAGQLKKMLDYNKDLTDHILKAGEILRTMECPDCKKQAN